MALTIDEKKEILALYGKGYSQRKIVDKLGYSERTVGNVIRRAAEEIMRLKSQGMSAEQIATRMDYTIAFVEIAIKNYGDKVIGKEEVKESDRILPEARCPLSIWPTCAARQTRYYLRLLEE